MAVAQQALQQGAQASSDDTQNSAQRPISRLPARRMSKDTKETMNCKSCRKRKIKCNRLKPSCEACSVFKCPCIYDAVPKKRGPKTDVLEALLKRVNGLEQRLKDEQQKSSSPEAESVGSTNEGHASNSSAQPEIKHRPSIVTRDSASESTQRPPIPLTVKPAAALPEQSDLTNAILDTYFACLHDKPFYILDENATRLRLRDGRLPSFLISALHAITSRYVPHLFGGHTEAARSSQTHADQSRSKIDVDEPNVENMQALLLLSTAYFQNGKGKKSQMVLNHAISMAFALNLHLELPEDLRIATSEREGRRKLFWTCYLMDRFGVAGSCRPASIGDEAIRLRLTAWRPMGSQTMVDGSFFENGSILPNPSGVSNVAQSSTSMLVEIVRILGIANHYLAAGGAKGDTHFPWHAQSALSRIRSALDRWYTATQDIFTSATNLFSSGDSSTLILSKLIYHLVQCLIYRPFLPIALTELSGSGSAHAWQLEATNLSFLHANAIAELVELGRRNGVLLESPSFVGYCIATAGSIHVHGAHYMSFNPGESHFNSAEHLSRSMSQLSQLSAICAGLQHQRDTLQIVYASHAELVNAHASGTSRFAPGFQMENFFDRYRGVHIDGAFVTFTDIVILDESTSGSISSWSSNVRGTPDYKLDRHLQQEAAGGHSSYQPSTASDDALMVAAKQNRSQSSHTHPLPTFRSKVANSTPSRSYSYEHPAKVDQQMNDPDPTHQTTSQHNNAFFPFAETAQNINNDAFTAFHFSDPFAMHQNSISATETGTEETSSVEDGSADGEVQEEDPFLRLLGSLGEGDSNALSSARVLEGEAMEFDWGLMG